MQTFIIGRDAGNQIVLSDNLVSRRHAQLNILDNGQIIIKDLGSSNGTFVNGNRIAESYLKSGDIVKCGAIFLNWSKYTNLGAVYNTNFNYNQPTVNQDYVEEPNTNSLIGHYNLSDVFKYLIFHIFEIGVLFKTTWDRIPSVIVLKAVPVCITFIASLIFYFKFRDTEFYFSPTILAVFIFSICPFITVYLLSLNKKVQVDKVALASGIIGFIQFCSILLYAIYLWVYYKHLSADYGNIFSSRFSTNKGFDLFIVVTALLFIIFLVNLAIAFYLFIYKYFMSIGFDKSKAIYLIVITVCLNLFFQILSSYIVYLIVKDSISIF